MSKRQNKNTEKFTHKKIKKNDKSSKKIDKKINDTEINKTQSENDLFGDQSDNESKNTQQVENVSLSPPENKGIFIIIKISEI